MRSHTDTKVWTKIANTTDTRHSSVRDFPDTGVSSTTLECNGRGMTRKYEVYIDMNKLHTALFHVDMLTSYFSTTSTLVVAVLNMLRAHATNRTVHPSPFGTISRVPYVR